METRLVTMETIQDVGIEHWYLCGIPNCQSHADYRMWNPDSKITVYRCRDHQYVVNGDN